MDIGQFLDGLVKLVTALAVLYAAWRGQRNGAIANQTHEIVNSQRTVMVNQIEAQGQTIATQQRTIETQANVLASVTPPPPPMPPPSP